MLSRISITNIDKVLMNQSIGYRSLTYETLIRSSRVDDKAIFIIFSKLVDDWYYLTIRLVQYGVGSYSFNGEKREILLEIYYKCDQLDGLVQAIENGISVTKSFPL